MGCAQSSKFGSLCSIIDYDYTTEKEVYEASGALEEMYGDGMINDYQYINIKSLLESILKSL